MAKRKTQLEVIESWRKVIEQLPDIRIEEIAKGRLVEVEEGQLAYLEGPGRVIVLHDEKRKGGSENVSV